MSSNNDDYADAILFKGLYLDPMIVGDDIFCDEIIYTGS